MIEGIYTSVSGMTAAMWLQARLGHDMTNANTVGYKHMRTSLSDFASLLESMDVEGNVIIADDGNGVAIAREDTDFSQGPLSSTNRPLDIAMSGLGFLEIQTPAGVRYTRVGRLHQNQGGMLITSEGHAVMGEGGPIQLPVGDVIITERGEILVDGVQHARLAIVEFGNPGALERVGGTAFAAGDGALPQAAESTRVQQGYLEGSNVDMSHDMATLIAITRLYQLAQRMTLAQDEVLNQTVNELARV
jgi:flagellar basal-body rod protein FlgF